MLLDLGGKENKMCSFFVFSNVLFIFSPKLNVHPFSSPRENIYVKNEIKELQIVLSGYCEYIYHMKINNGHYLMVIYLEA